MTVNPNRPTFESKTGQDAALNPNPAYLRSSAEADPMHLLGKQAGSDNVSYVLNLNRIQSHRRADRFFAHTNHPTHFLNRAQALWCRLFRGHDFIRTYHRGRIYLECCHCGARTPGWEVIT